MCPECASPEIKSCIADLVLQRELEFIDPDAGTLDELLITLPNCKHVFTVETLDGHCDMSEYYERDGVDGEWLGLKAPPIGFRKPPTCPTCRSAITSPRYGRVFKRADLDILENNVAFHMSQALQEVIRRVSSVPLKEICTRLKNNASLPSLQPNRVKEKTINKRERQRKALLKETRLIPINSKTLDPSDKTLHGVVPIEVKVWRQAVQPLLNAYRGAENVTNIRSSHQHAWEASFSYLYRKEMEDITNDPDNAPPNPHEYATQLARFRVGQPPPRADKRFYVEAFWATISIRLSLAEATTSWLAGLASRKGYPKISQYLWETYTVFLLKTCRQDAETALTIATESESHRQVLKTKLILLRIDLEQFRLNISKSRNSQSREILCERATEKLQEAHNSAAAALAQYFDMRDQDEEWVRQNFGDPVVNILQEFGKLERSIRMETFYEPLSLEEMSDIVKGLNFGHTGHFYKCPNGHTFVITECGGATQVSICPECGAQIGGTSHRLLDSNVRDTEFEALAATHGARRNPWAT
ncbi:hypothetical protein QCA50_011669 [Cerrena zonata]|uniref:RZ-type domain-containing protein n=1 Tax=Cerrena zonata TaxID=2478898 RepID=A0AAW0G6L0_9APHY